MISVIFDCPQKSYKSSKFFLPLLKAPRKASPIIKHFKVKIVTHDD